MPFLSSLFKPNIKQLEAARDIQGLLKAAQHKDETVRIEAINALGDLGDPQALPNLRAAVDDIHESIPLAAVRAIGKISPPHGLEALVGLLKSHRSIEIRRISAEALGKAGSASVIPSLVEALSDPDQGVKAQSALALRQLGWQGAEAEREIQRCLENPSASCLPILQQMALDPEEPRRQPAICALGSLDDPAVAPLLIQVLVDGDYASKASAAAALGNLGSKDAVQPLVEVIQDEIARAYFRDEDDIQLAPDDLYNPDRSAARCAAMEALAKIDEWEAAFTLVEALGDDDEAAAGTAQRLLDKIHEEEDKRDQASAKNN